MRLGADVVLPWDGRDHYLAGVYRTALADRVAELVAAGERSMRALVDTVDTQRVVMSEQPALTNVNTAADLRASANRQQIQQMVNSYTQSQLSHVNQLINFKCDSVACYWRRIHLHPFPAAGRDGAVTEIPVAEPV